MFVVPGDCISRANESLTPLNGTFTRNQHVFASIAGTVLLTDDSTSLQVIPVGRKRLQPTDGALVTCRVLSITQSHARLEIVCIEDQVLKQPFRAILRKEQINKEPKTEVWKCFRPSDVILARVVGEAADGRNGFLVSTAENELGVVVAVSRLSGLPMRPISWTQMVCPNTWTVESRKVAQLV